MCFGVIQAAFDWPNTSCPVPCYQALAVGSPQEFPYSLGWVWLRQKVNSSVCLAAMLSHPFPVCSDGGFLDYLSLVSDQKREVSPRCVIHLSYHTNPCSKTS